jgi:dTDP-4-amino-4,6-dideoxygalactose transaminase
MVSAVSVPMLDLRAEYFSLKEEIDEAVQRVIDSGTFVMGKEVDLFEEAFARYCGAEYAVGVGSGTAALHMALLGCGIGPGDEVITVPNTDIPTTMTVSHCGARIVWVDVDPRTFNMDAARIEDRITEKTKAILPVHLFGHPADMDAILSVAKRHDLLVIEDAALAVGATYRESKVGAIGDVGCFSLASTKILGAYGDAGIVVTNRRDIADRVRVLSNYGHALETRMELGGVIGIRTWKLIAEGFNEHLDTLQAAILSAKLPALEERIARRREVAHRYDECLTDIDVVTPYEAEYARHVYRAYTILVNDRERVRDYLASKGIASRIYYVPPLHLQPVYRELGYHRNDFPIAEDTAARMLALPIFPEMTDEQTTAVATALAECVPSMSH